VPTSKGQGSEGNREREGRRKGREGEWQTPVPDWESAKVATLEQNDADTIGTVLIPWAGHFQC